MLGVLRRFLAAVNLDVTLLRRLLLDEAQPKVGKDGAAARGLFDSLFRPVDVLKDFRARQRARFLHRLLILRKLREYLLSHLTVRRRHVAFSNKYALVAGEGKIE